ncbi:MAG: hypothetical protein R2752_11055 [Vicinamibacterales bacterium]
MPKFTRLAVLALVAAGIGCSNGVDVDDVPLGSAVQLVRDDGALVEGTLAARTNDDVTVATGETKRDVPRGEIADLEVVDKSAPMPPPPAAATYREVVLPEGSALHLELQTPLDTSTAGVGDRVSARLADPIRASGRDVLPAGAEVSGRVTSVEPAGKVKGRATLAIEFTDVTARGETMPIAARFAAVAPASTKEDAKKIGIPAAGGAVLGAILGGGKGAAIGAAIGGGAGTGAVLLTPGDEIRLGDGARLSVTLMEAMTVKIPIER